MGFYSFYKILKDMVRTIFGKKFLKITIIVILIFIIFFVYNECFALSTIPPISVDGVTFNFTNSGWSADHASYRGNMDNITILRYEVSTNQYLYVFSRSSYPIYVNSYKSGNYTITQTRSYNGNGEASYIPHNRVTVSRTSTIVDSGTPSFR